MLHADRPALVLAPMEGITDAPMRALQGEIGAFTYGVTEFLRVNEQPLSAKVFVRDIPELGTQCKTCTGLPVQVQLLGGDPERLAQTAATAVEMGAKGVDLNFGCPAKTVNRHDGGASLLRFPTRIRDIVAAVRQAVPLPVPVSAKLRLGWDSVESIDENAAMAAEGGANWLTIHARTRMQGYAPPVFWEPIGRVREALGLPIIANGDIWTFDDFLRCRDASGCRHFMLGRSALANPELSWQIAAELGLPRRSVRPDFRWQDMLHGLVRYSESFGDPSIKTLLRLKQWLSFASKHGDFAAFDAVKRAESLEQFFAQLESTLGPCPV